MSNFIFIKKNNTFLSLPLTLGTIFGVFIGDISRDVKISGLVAALTSGMVIFANIKSERWNSWQLKNNLLISKLLLLLSVGCCYLFTYPVSIEKKTLPIIFFAVGYLLTNYIKKRNFDNLLIGINTSFTLIVLYGLSVGHTFSGYYLKEFATYSVMLVGGICSNLFNFANRKGEINKAKNIFLKSLDFLLSFIVSIFLLISVFRKDYLEWVHGSLFHWFYFVGPVAEYQAGGGLDTLNQYSQGALMMASKLSISPWFSVYLFQIIIYLITVLCLIFLSINKSGTSKLIIAALGFLLLFSDPSSVGPQSFPSSGLFRFFPLVTWALYFTNGSIELSRQSSFRKIKKIFNKIILSLALITSFLWSGEMLICTLISVFLVTIFKFYSHIIVFLKNIKIRLKSENFKKNFLKIILYLSIPSLIFGFILKNNILHNDFLEQIISYPFSYLNKNYGWYEPGAWITIAPLYALLSISALVLFSNTNVLKKVGFISCCGLALGYVAYRPVSNNITAVMPTALILVSSFFSKKVFLGLEQKIMKDEQLISLLPYRGIILAIAGTSAFLQVTNFQRLNQIISVSAGSSLGEFKEMGGQNIVNYPNCEEGDKSLSKLILDKELIRDIRQSKTGVSFIGHNYNYLWSLGNCHKFNGKLYHPLVFQPSQLYFPPLDLGKSKLAVKKVLEKRKFKKIVFLSLVKDDKAKLNRKYFFDLLPEEWKNLRNYSINNEIEAFIWGK